MASNGNHPSIAVAKCQNASRWKPLSLSTSATPETHSSDFSDYGFIDTIALAQKLGVNFLPISPQVALGQLNRGGQAEIYQALINLQTAFAFKAFVNSSNKDECNFREIINEMIVLSHPLIKKHPHIVRLEGICWDPPSSGRISPTLLFEKASIGDLGDFIPSTRGQDISLENKLSLCIDIGIAVRDMHANGE
jgi:hypothetical protein